MTWNYRVVRKKEKTGHYGYGIAKVYYGDDGETTGFNNTLPAYGCSLEDLRLTLNLMRAALKKPMLELKHGKLVWCDPDEAPELTKEWFENAHLYNGGKLIRKGKGTPPKDFE